VSCDKNINLTLNVHTAAVVRDQLFQDTRQDSYEFPGQRTIALRTAIVALDEQIEEALKDHEDSHS
tara:strand:+ start:162 stop:359 length:198 start_codon:yes stop_codon:yes gene_type:complete